MKIVIEKIGDNVGVSFIGKGQRIDRLMLLTVALIETFVESLIPDLTDEQLQQAADGFANSVKSAVIARYKMKPSERKEEFTGKEAAFSLSCSIYDRAKRKGLPVRQHGQAQREHGRFSPLRVYHRLRLPAICRRALLRGG